MPELDIQSPVSDTAKEGQSACAITKSGTLQPGTSLTRGLEVRKFLGAGSGGAVYLCADTQDNNRLKAVKLLSNSYFLNEVSMSRFYLEGKAARRVKSDNVVECYDIIVADGLFAYTMEYVEGVTLEEYLRLNPNLPIHRCLDILQQVVQGLEAIHAQKIVHRDLKPQNILLNADMRAKITDFGIARIPGRETLVGKASESNIILSGESSSPDGGSLTESGAILGTLDYISPEYISDNQIDERSDIYALGVIGYKVITGGLPFQGKNPFDRMWKKVATVPKRISEVRPECPELLSLFIASTLEKDPVRRPQTAADLSKALMMIAGQ